MFSGVVQDRATATRQKLIHCAMELIRKIGYVATTIDDICRHSGVTKGAFFHHFKTKEELAEFVSGNAPEPSSGPPSV